MKWTEPRSVIWRKSAGAFLSAQRLRSKTAADPMRIPIPRCFTQRRLLIGCPSQIPLKSMPRSRIPLIGSGSGRKRKRPSMRKTIRCSGHRDWLLDSLRELAEGVGFEPTEHRCSAVFKTAAIDHSATPPNKPMENATPDRRWRAMRDVSGMALFFTFEKSVDTLRCELLVL